MGAIVDITVPFEQEGTKATVIVWNKRIGDRVELDEPLLELETDKVTQEIPAPAAGRLTDILLDTGADALPGAVLGRIDTQADAAPTDTPATQNNDTPTRTAPETGLKNLTHYSPSVRRAAQEYDIDPATVHGTGRGGRVTRADMEAAREARAAQAAQARTESHADVRYEPAKPPASAASASAASASPASASGSDGSPASQKVPHSNMRLAIAQHMAASVATAPHVTAVFEADWTAIMRHRERHKAQYAAESISLSYTAYIVAACVAAMREVPAVNSRWHDDCLEIFDDVNIGIGTALGDKGLVVPVIHKAQDLSLKGIARRLQEITNGARNGALSSRDVRGGTFTISNHGVSGSLIASPIIINQPQSAILGVGKLEKRAVVREIDGIDAIQIRPMAYVSLTIDHRALDGHQTNAWLTRFVQTLEQWPQ